MPTKPKNKKHKKSARKPAPKAKAKKAQSKPAAKPAPAPRTIEKSEPQPQLTKSFVARAEQWDADIRAGLHDVGVKWTRLGQRAAEGSKLGYYKAITDSRKLVEGKANPNFGKKFARFDQWATATFEKASSTIFRAMSMVKELTEGPNAPLTPAQLADLPKNNAEGLARMKRKGVKITPQVVEQARTMPTATFQQRVEMPMTGSGEPVQKQFSKMLPLDVYNELQEAIEIGKYVARDDDREISLEAKAIQAIAREFKSTYQHEYDEYCTLREEQERAKQRVANEGEEDEFEEEEEEEEGAHVPE